MHSHFPVFHTHMHMEPKDQIAACRLLEFIYDLVITNMVCYQLAFPMAKRMRARSAHPKAKAFGNLRDGCTKNSNIPKRLVDVLANVCAYFHNRLVHFSLHFVFDDLL